MTIKLDKKQLKWLEENSDDIHQSAFDLNKNFNEIEYKEFNELNELNEKAVLENIEMYMEDIYLKYKEMKSL